MDLLRMSICGSVLILIIWICQKILLYRLPKWLFDVLWKFSALYLLLPFSFSCSWSWQNLFTSPAVIPSGIAVPSGVTNGVWTQNNPPPQSVAVSAAPQDSPLTIIWICGAILLLASVLLNHLLHRLQLCKNNIPINAKGLSVHGCYALYRNSFVHTPISYGLFRPVIILPNVCYDLETQSNIIFHETEHIRRGDLWMKLFLLFALSIHWFNPFVWLMYFCSNHMMELACDEAVLRRHPEDIRAGYARTLLRLSQEKAPTLPLAGEFGYHTGKERIYAIMKYKKTGITAITVSLILAGGILTVFATSPSKSSETSSVHSAPEPLSLSSCISEPASTVSQDILTSSRDCSDSPSTAAPSAEPAPAPVAPPDSLGNTVSKSIISSSSAAKEETVSSELPAPSVSPSAPVDGLLLTWPLPQLNGTTQTITQPFGRSVTFSTMHNAVDMTVLYEEENGMCTAVASQPVVASFDGVIESVSYHQLYGNVIRVRHSESVYMEYQHVDNVSVSQGQNISAGMQLCTLGRTGLSSTGIHVHLSLNIDGEWVDPMLYFGSKSS